MNTFWLRKREDGGVRTAVQLSWQGHHTVGRHRAQWSRVRQSLGTLGLPWNSVLPCWDFQGMEYFLFIPQMEEVVSFLSALVYQLPFLNWLLCLIWRANFPLFTLLSPFVTFLTSGLFCSFIISAIFCLTKPCVSWGVRGLSEAFPFLKSIIFSLPSQKLRCHAWNKR